MSTNSKKYPDFFKVFLPDHSSERMKIPVAFVACLHENLPENTILRSHSGKDWHVNIHNFGSCFFFDDGWKQFVEANSLEVGDFLVFSYDGGNVFKFKTFDSSYCEKGTIKEEEEEEEEEDDDDEEDDGDEEKEEGDDDDDDEADDDYVIDDECMEEEEEQEAVKGGSRKVPHIRNRNFASKDEATELEGYGIDIETYVQPENPYFITKLKAKRKNELAIPMRVIRDYDLSLPGSITIRDPLNRISNGKVVTWNDGRVCILGWGAVCRRNRISVNDVCICEFKLRENLMQVHII